jgi:flavin-binding protein dodecin
MPAPPSLGRASVSLRMTDTKRQGDALFMSGTYKVIELVGTSPMSFAEAVKSAVAEASKTVRHMDWFEVVNERGSVVEGKVAEFQVTLKVGFKIER